MKRFIPILLISIYSTLGWSQYEEKQVGLRFGSATGITVKVIQNDRLALEGIVGIRQGGIQIYGLLESYRPLMFNFKHDFRIYYGGGAHLGFVNGYYNKYWWNTSEKDGDQRVTGAAIGLDGIVGLSYHFRTFPLSVGFEAKPFVELQAFNHLVIEPFSTAFFLRLTL